MGGNPARDHEAPIPIDGQKDGKEEEMGWTAMPGVTPPREKVTKWYVMVPHGG
jgi:hypothetical protein